MGFYASYKPVFDAVKTAVSTKSSIKTVLLGEQFTVGSLPKAVINATQCSISPIEIGKTLGVKINFEVIAVILSLEPKDWFDEIISVMADVADSILADRTLGGKANDCYPTLFMPGEIKFANKIYYVGIVGFTAEVWYEP